ncbi:hypothetical protein FOA52_002391 [Chlamydomonas sp. UWO 241]|nr:hypothetical protein FOA52_002391 [Chlamydomonas sp. UWO 241]
MPLLSPIPSDERSTLPSPGAPRFHNLGLASYFPEVDTTLLEQSQERHAVFRSELVVDAYLLAGRAYSGQERHDGSSVLSHCVLTALTLADYGLDETTVAAGLLAHALRSNNEAFRSQVEEFMPTAVVQLVDRVTTMSAISDIYRHNRDGMDDEALRQMLLAMEDVKAVLVTLAGRVHDMAACNKLPQPERSLLAQETLDIYSVVANRLGCWSIKAELEDAAFRELHPAEYDALREQVHKRQDPAALEATVSAIKGALDDSGIRYEDISGRGKNLYSIWVKMRADGVTTIDSIFDITALRVVVSGNKHDCYVAQRCVQQLYRCMPQRSKDFIRVIKKANGYQSLHETIYGECDTPVEVQIRTSKMHYIAEYGFAAHWKYKENLDNGDKWFDKEVQYKKWLMNYKLGFHDKKIRPSGSSPTDGSLKSLGAHLLDLATNPEHAAKVDPFLMHDRFKLSLPDKRPVVRVMLQTQDSVEQREVPASLTGSQLAAELNVASLPGYVLTVNQRLPEGSLAESTLRDGDLVQVLPLSQHLSRSPPEQRWAPRSVPLPVAEAVAGVSGRSALRTASAPRSASTIHAPTPSVGVPALSLPGALGGGLSSELDIFALGSEMVTLDWGRGSSGRPMAAVLGDL